MICVCVCVCVCMCTLSGVQLFATPWTIARQAPWSMGYSRQEFWSGLPFPFPGDLPNPGIEPTAPAASPALRVNSLLLNHLGSQVPNTYLNIHHTFKPHTCGVPPHSSLSSHFSNPLPQILCYSLSFLLFIVLPYTYVSLKKSFIFPILISVQT